MRTYLATLSRAHDLLEQLLEATIIETGLSASELLVMQVAFEAEEPSIGVILRSTCLRPTTLSSLLRRSSDKATSDWCPGVVTDGRVWSK